MRTRKFQIPSSKLQRNFKSQISNWLGVVRVWVLGFWFFLATWNLAFGASDGFGPPISVSHDLPATNTHPLPAANWIDQTRDDAMHKSQGCMECHRGLENP